MPANYLTGYAPTNMLAYGGMDPSMLTEAQMRGQMPNNQPQSYADILNANTAARTQTIRTPGGQTIASSDPNFSQAGDFQQMLAGSPFRKPAQMQDWASSAGVPFDSSAYTKRYNNYWDSQHPNLQGVGGWMHNHPVGTIAAFIAAAAGGSALSGYGLGGTGSGWGGGAVGGGAGGGGSGGFGSLGGGEVGGEVGGGGVGSVVGDAAGGSFSGGSIAGGGAAGGGAAGGGAAAGGGGLGLFANGGTGGMAGAGGGNAGALGASGGISGGSGVGGTSGALGGGSGWLLGSSGAGGNMGWGDWVNLADQAYGAYAQGQGASNAANAQVKGDAAALAEQRREFDLARGDQMPWLQSGTAALGRLNDPNAFTASPSYNFVKNEAMNGVQNSAAARGGLYSGNTLRALQDRGANVASQEYNNWFNQQSSLAGNGQASAQSLGLLGQQNSNNVSNLLSQQGNARASGIEGQTNALTGSISDFLSWYNRRRQGGG